jgi:preprotein translocase subunit SecE
MVTDVKTFFKESKAELAKVTWPDRKTTLASTVVVVVVSLIVGAYLGLLDVILTKVFEFIFS